MELLDFTIKIAQKTGKFLLKEKKKGLEINEKKANDFVTNLDRAAEEMLIDLIKSAYPDHAILAEESHFLRPEEISEITQAEYVWIIDPIDGTKNFIRELPHYCISIGIFRNYQSEKSKNYQYISGELVVGVVHAPQLDETFSAAKGQGSKLNGKKIQVSDYSKLSKSVFATGFPPDHKETNIPYFLKVIHETGGMRRLGSAALDLCNLACGRIDGFWEFGLHPWDISAGALIVEEAGGKVSDINDNPLDLFGKDILATNGKIHPATVKLFSDLGE